MKAHLTDLHNRMAKKEDERPSPTVPVEATYDLPGYMVTAEVQYYSQRTSNLMPRIVPGESCRLSINLIFLYQNWYTLPVGNTTGLTPWSLEIIPAHVN